MLLELQNLNYWVLINDFAFALDSSDIDLWNIDLLDTHTFRFVRYKYSHFFRLQDVLKMLWRHVLRTSSRHVFQTPSRHVFKTSSRHAFKTSSRHVFKACLQDVFNVTIFRLPKCLQDFFKTSSRRLARCFQDVFARRLQDVLEDKKLLHWRHVEDVFKASSRPTNVCWAVWQRGIFRLSLIRNMQKS